MEKYNLYTLSEEWVSSIRQLFEGVENTNSSDLKEEINKDSDDDVIDSYKESRLRLEKEIEDIEFRLRRGSESGRFDQFWDDDGLFECRYSRGQSKTTRKN